MSISKRIKIANIQRLLVAVQKLRHTMHEGRAFWKHPHAKRPYKGFGKFSIMLKSFMAENHEQVYTEDETYYKTELYNFYQRIKVYPGNNRKLGNALQHYFPNEYNHLLQLMNDEFRRLADVELDFLKK